MHVARITTPGKVILFGEYAAIFGHPAVAIAVDRYMRAEVSRISNSHNLRFLENRRPISIGRSGHVSLALDLFKVYFREHADFTGVYNMDIDSDFPSASGMGSSAAVSVTALASFLAAAMHVNGGVVDKGHEMEARLARASFEVEYLFQGRASPLDTSTVVHGHGVMVSGRMHPDYEHLWTLRRGRGKWCVHHITLPKDFLFVVGYSGVKGRTVEAGITVDRLMNRHRGFGMDMMGEIGSAAEDGMRALKHGDIVALGEAMNRTHHALCAIGLSHPSLNKMVDAALKRSYGAKITGAGGGGCILALTDQDGAEATSTSLRERGFEAFTAHISHTGVSIELANR